MPRKFAITVAYDGTDFGGWQLQINAITIQQRLMEAIAKATTERHQVVGDGMVTTVVHVKLGDLLRHQDGVHAPRSRRAAAEAGVRAPIGAATHR